MGITFNFAGKKAEKMPVRLQMRFRRDSLPVVLMILSMCLLIVLQILWLEGAWKQSRENFRTETNNLFRQTIFGLHDSLLMRNIEPLQGDSVIYQKRVFVTGANDTYFANTEGDTLKGGRGTPVMEVYISNSPNDSIRQMLPRLIRKMRMDKNHQRFLVRVNDDSLSSDSVAMRFARDLRASGIDVPFNLHRHTARTRGWPDSRGASNASLVSDPVPFSPMTFYSVSFPSANVYLLRTITTQILFSIFVTLLTAGAFFTMHASIRSQRKVVEMKNDFISNVSHELKTPVSTVSVALEAMEKFEALDDPKKAGEYVRMARNELNRLNLMTDKILQITAFENREPQIHPENIDLDREIAKILESMKLLFEKGRIQVGYDRQGSDFHVIGSRAHLVTVIYNLIDNAIKYSVESSRIDVRLTQEGETVNLEVKDNGIGIPAAYHKKVFEKFFRVPNGDVHNAKGYGLGLNYVARVIKHHKGVVHLESEPGKGSTFNVRLPKNFVAG